MGDSMMRVCERCFAVLVVAPFVAALESMSSPSASVAGGQLQVTECGDVIMLVCDSNVPGEQCQNGSKWVGSAYDATDDDWYAKQGVVSCATPNPGASCEGAGYDGVLDDDCL